ncbi:DUF3987 domain-containing protein [Desulfonatronum thiodismutans]|uniref:DUF3987 domain-containing protein n=1 Tax=Desulfonatronum thiodismutans TaxID=159290 RepID=UPI000691CE9E|nr:DUF3987 domain-containing protein [Desulfonatronum thiodismutans]
MKDYILQFQEHIGQAGLRPSSILADGNLHRCPVEGGKQGTRDGVYKLHPDRPPSGYYKNHKTGEEGTWTSSTKEGLSQADRDRLRQRIEKDRQEAAAKLKRERQATARAARAMLAKAVDCSGSHYLAKKGVGTAPGLKELKDVLLVPRLNVKGEVISLVRIWEDGTKKNLPGATYPGGFFAIKGADGPLLICEGVSTGLSLHMGTGLTVVCSFDCGNLLAVAEGARSKYPEREIIICADMDGHQPGNPGLTYATKATQAVDGKLAVPSTPGKAKVDFNDVHQALGLEVVKAQVEAAQTVEPDPQAQDHAQTQEQNQAEADRWLAAQRLFPRVPFPWDVLPDRITTSLKQLARSCAGSALALPGVALSVTAAAVGNLVAVSPKRSWREPLIFYMADIRESGEGKTAPLWELCRPMIQRQEQENERADMDQREYDSLDKKDKYKAEKPRPARGYFATGCTLEGLRQDLTSNPTGGIIIIQSELSSFISGQNQYKGGGDDREGWLCLHDGRPARVVRAGGRTAYIKGARPQVTGGIQPEIFRKAFTSLDGVYMTDGTVYRFLPTFEPPSHFDLTSEAWTEENRVAWEQVISRALAWSDHRTNQDQGLDFNGPDRLDLILDQQAQDRFFDWRNHLSSQKHELPALVRGFTPKTVGYALRLAGALHLLRAFAAGEEPRPVLTLAGIEDGIRLAMFYAGQAVDALRLLQGKDEAQVQEVSDRTLRLARTLADLKLEIDSGRLAVGLIQERYNQRTTKTDQFRTAKSMGAFIRSLRLSVSEGKHHANGRQGVFCLLWDQKAEDFIKRFKDVVDQKQRAPHSETGANAKFEDVEDIEGFAPHSGEVENTGLEDVEGVEDFISEDEVII